MFKGLEILAYSLFLVIFFILFIQGSRMLRAQANLPLISILLMAKNQEDSIEGLLRKISSLHHRARFPFEIVVVDLGSTDQTVAILPRLSRTLSFALLTDDYRGEGESFMDIGLHQCRGDLVCLAGCQAYGQHKQIVSSLESVLGVM